MLILKFGSSLLSSRDGFRLAAGEVVRHARAGRGVVAVCSARRGVTDALFSSACDVSSSPRPELLAALVATGEAASVALLAMAVEACGLSAAALDNATVGLRTQGDPLDGDPVAVDVAALRGALARHGVVVVPGFVGTGAHGGPTVLGRGGSDLTALFLAHRLGAEECHLVKDVDGLYPMDPNTHTGGRSFPHATWDEVRTMGGGLVQEKALAYAQRHDVAFRIVAPGGVGTWVASGLRAAS